MGTRAPAALLSGVPPNDKVVHHWNRLRLLAMVDIANFHFSNEYLAGGIGLPIFLLLTMSLVPSAKEPVELRVVWRRRARRLAGPWLFWNLALLGWLCLVAVRHGRAPLGWAEPAMLFGGVQPHMWFLPFAAVTGLGVAAVDRVARHISSSWVAAGCLGIAAVLPAVHAQMDYSEPFSQWAFALPALPLGLGLAGLLRDATRDGARRIGPLIAYTVGYGALTWGFQHAGFDPEGDGRRYALALGVMVGVWLLPNFSDRFTRTMEPLLMGVFVLHGVVGFSVFMRFVPQGTFPQWFETICALAVTTVIVALFRRTPLRRVL